MINVIKTSLFRSQLQTLFDCDNYSWTSSEQDISYIYSTQFDLEVWRVQYLQEKKPEARVWREDTFYLSALHIESCQHSW